MRKSRLPAGGTNLFQEIKAMCAEAEKNGKKLYRLSIGQPRGPALLSARRAAAAAIMSEEESMHEYQDNGSPGVPGFAQEFVQGHMPETVDLSLFEGVSYLPTPGTKPMLGLIPMACGGIENGNIDMCTMTDPGYPTPADQAKYRGMNNSTLLTYQENQFLFSTDDMYPRDELLMLNYPHNPSGQVAGLSWWMEICAYCVENNIRLFNDAAYAILVHDKKSAATLTEAAIHFPELSWAEAFSASKVIANGTGWRIGAICGSPDFVGDIATIKGNTDSGFFAPAAVGVLAALKNDRASIERHRRIYEDRISLLGNILDTRGMRLAVEPKAGFFTLWMAPTEAFGQDIKDAKQFNSLMIQNTGIVGVPFGPYIRYSVTAPIEDPEWKEAIEDAFSVAEVEY